MNNEADKNRFHENLMDLDMSVGCLTQTESQLPRLEPRDRLPPDLFNRDWIESKIAGSGKYQAVASSCFAGGHGASGGTEQSNNRDLALTSSYLFNKIGQLNPSNYIERETFNK